MFDKFHILSSPPTTRLNNSKLHKHSYIVSMNLMISIGHHTKFWYVYAQMPLINAYAGVNSEDRGLTFGLADFYIHTLCM